MSDPPALPVSGSAAGGGWGVNCGAHFAPSCAECLDVSPLIRTTCAGDCAPLGRACAPILAPEHSVVSLAAARPPVDAATDDVVMFPSWERAATEAIASAIGLRPPPRTISRIVGGGGAAAGASTAVFAELNRASRHPRRTRMVGVLREPFAFAVELFSRYEAVAAVYSDGRGGGGRGDVQFGVGMGGASCSDVLRLPDVAALITSSLAALDAPTHPVSATSAFPPDAHPTPNTLLHPWPPNWESAVDALFSACPNPLARTLAQSVARAGRALHTAHTLGCAVNGSCSNAWLRAVGLRTLQSLDGIGLASHPIETLGVLKATLAAETKTKHKRQGGEGEAGGGGGSGGGAGSGAVCWRTDGRRPADPHTAAAPISATHTNAAPAPAGAAPPPAVFASLGAVRERWNGLARIDISIYDMAVGAFVLRMRVARKEPIPQGGGAGAASPIPQGGLDGGAPPVPLHEFMRIARVFGNDYGRGRRPAVLGPPPVSWDWALHTLVFVHMAKCGGTSFNHRLVSLTGPEGAPPPPVSPLAAAGPPRVSLGRCACAVVPDRFHNGHPLVKDRNCACPRSPLDAARMPLPGRQVLGKRADGRFLFLDEQWLVSPETTGWHGGVHAPVAHVQASVMLSAKAVGRRALAQSLHYVTMLREPAARFLSEFYESYNGWEYDFGTPPRLRRPCSSFLPAPLQPLATRGIDHAAKSDYDLLFPHWLSCPKNVAADRQTRSLTHDAWAVVAGSASGYRGIGRGERRLERAVCGRLPVLAPTANDSAAARRRRDCLWLLARHALLQFDYFGINEQRCLSEKLFEAQFGLRFGWAGGGAAAGEGAHRVAKLKMEELTEPQRQRIARLNRNDILLYREALRIFRWRLRLYGVPENATCDA